MKGGKTGRRSSSLHDCDCVKSKHALIKGIVNAVKSLFHPNGSSNCAGSENDY